MRTITRCRNTASSTIPKPSWSYTSASICRSSTNPVDSSTSQRLHLHRFSCWLEQCALPAGHGLFDRNLGHDTQVEGLLIGFEPGTSAFEELPEFDVGVGGTDVFDDLLLAPTCRATCTAVAPDLVRTFLTNAAR
ncbi:hypothetical protein IRZ34_02450 [Rhodococcus rhodochrous]|uniref:hypothetical protein n=1 Tax=Rhodococcus rhodochrous TaxID=1829 RepID=UPI00188DBE40|nr:hypothetical protein [Rhodococcus rhodochrous]